MIAWAIVVQKMKTFKKSAFIHKERLWEESSKVEQWDHQRLNKLC